MFFGHLHSREPLQRTQVIDALKGMIQPGFIHKRGNLRVGLVGPWRPADLWPGAMETAVWSVLFEIERDTLFSKAGEEKLRRGSIERRMAPLHPAELLVRALGNGLVTLFSDSGLAYVLVWRERHLRCSIMLENHIDLSAGYLCRVIRCDGVQVVVETEPKELPEEDRVGVLLEGFFRWMGERVPVDADTRIFVPDQLGGLAEQARWEQLIQDGEWVL